MSLYSLISPLGDIAYLVLWASFLSGFLKGKGRRQLHHWLSAAALALITLHALLILYLRSPL